MNSDGGADSIKQPPDRWVALGLGILVYASCIGQSAGTSIFAQPIKEEFGLSDAGVVFLISTVYAGVFLAAVVPFGIAADKTNRRNLLSFASALFSIAYALQGLATSYFLLLLARIGVGVGHSATGPVSISLIADKFAPHRRTAILALLGVGSSIGAWACISGGGYLESLYGWRQAVIVIGLVGLAITVLFYLLVREPVRGALDSKPAASTAAAPAPSFMEAMRFVWTQRAVFHSIVGSGVLAFWGFGMAWWLPAYLSRSFGLTTGQAGAALGPIHGIVGITAALFASALFLRLGAKDPRKPMWFLAAMAVLTTLPTIALVYAQSVSVVILMAWLYLPMLYIYSGPAHAIVIAGLPPNMRGQAIALKFCLTMVCSLALAPQAVGILSDIIAPRIANPEESLRWALLPLALTGFWAAAHFWFCAKHVREDLARLGAAAPAPANAAGAPATAAE